MKPFLAGKGWPIANVRPTRQTEVAGEQRCRSLLLELTVGQQATFAMRLLTGNISFPPMACLTANGTIDERAISIVHPVEYVAGG
eukprot:2492222-Pyramimonas_sp.AAC.1